MELTAQNMETVIRLGLFFGLFVCFFTLEILWPRKALSAPKLSRWFGNLTITISNTLTLQLVFVALGVTAVGLGAIAQSHGWGLLNHFALPAPLAFALGLLLLDLAIYTQHLIFHRVPLLWRLHRMHHADTDIDVSTGLRFHPIEILLSMAIKMGLIIVLGISPWAILVFEIVLNATSMFNHANMALPLWLDRALRLVVVTPDMHRVHHSVNADEYNSNYGFNLPWWDRVFSTYTDQPTDGHADMKIGLPTYRTDEWRRLAGLLSIPFRSDTKAGGNPK
jgi:sterol desaturase/sphingolipid hydroxylase (fatty acid hydroxylase superfamily)